MRVILALDKFKGTLTAMEACECVRQGLEASASPYLEGAVYTLCPIADGGDGTVEALASRLPGELREISVENAVGSRPVKAAYLLEGATAYLEMAAASGLALLDKEERDPLRATTFGTGQMMAAALDAGARRLVIGLGGSATNDGGTGLARALGYRFLDRQGNELVHPIDFQRLERMIRPVETRSFECLVLADVTNPLLGRAGATAVYGPQKGVMAKDVDILEAGLVRLAEVVARDCGCDFRETPGAGAAGGSAFGLMSFFGARLVPGFDFVSECMGLEREVVSADLVVTGEGRMDGQTLSGKGPCGVARLAKKHGARVVALCGSVAEEARADLEATFSLLSALIDEVGVSDSMAHPRKSLVETSRRLGQRLRFEPL